MEKWWRELLCWLNGGGSHEDHIDWTGVSIGKRPTVTCVRCGYTSKLKGNYSS